jgi:hypothetical protein
MEDEQDFRPSLGEFAAAVLEQLDPLSPASMRLSQRPMRVTDWGGACMEAGPSSLVRPTEATDSDQETASAPARRRGIDLKASLRRNRHRGRERRDVLYLQAYSQMLERRLQELQERRERDASLSVEQRQDQSLQRSRVKLWRSLAKKQRHERTLAEQENIQLRAMWRSQLEFAAQMQELTAVPRALGPANGGGARVTICTFDSDALTALVRDLDLVYEQSGPVLQEIGLADVPDACFKSVRPRDRDGTGNLDLVDVIRVPVDFGSLREATWDTIISKIVSRGGVRVNALPQQDNNTLLTVKVRYRMTPLQLGSQENGDQQDEAADAWYFESVMALRKYVVSPEREMAVWKSLITGDGGMSGLVVSETGYSVMHRSVEDPRSSVFKRVRRIEAMAARPATPASRPGNSVADEDATSMVDIFSKLSLSATEDDVHGALRAFGLESAGQPCTVHGVKLV